MRPQPTVGQVSGLGLVKFVCSWSCCYVIIINVREAHDLFVHCRPSQTLLSFHPLPSPATMQCGRQGRWERLRVDRRPSPPRFHGECQVMHWSSEPNMTKIGAAGTTLPYCWQLDRSCLRQLRWSGWSNIWGTLSGERE